MAAALFIFICAKAKIYRAQNNLSNIINKAEFCQWCWLKEFVLIRSALRRSCGRSGAAELLMTYAATCSWRLRIVKGQAKIKENMTEMTSFFIFKLLRVALGLSTNRCQSHCYFWSKFYLKQWIKLCEHFLTVSFYWSGNSRNYNYSIHIRVCW